MGRRHLMISCTPWIRACSLPMGGRQGGIHVSAPNLDGNAFYAYAWRPSLNKTASPTHSIWCSVRGATYSAFSLALVAADWLPLLHSEGSVKSTRSLYTPMYTYSCIYVVVFLSCSVLDMCVCCRHSDQAIAVNSSSARHCI